MISMTDTLSKLEFYFDSISIKKLHPNSVINFDLYIKAETKFVLYKNRNLVVHGDDLQRLVETGLETLYIHTKDKKNFRTYVEGNLENILKSEHVPIEKKAEALHESAINVVEDIFNNPRSGSSIKRSKEIIGNTVDFIIGTPGAFANLLKIRKHDYYTYTHSVNVCTFLVSLARELGISDKKTLKEVGEGGLLHDLGKSLVPSAIINKQGQLLKSEWELMQKHPDFGTGIAKDTREISPVSLTIIGQHHERMTGTGYPTGVSGGELNVYANMASIVDVYDALTTNRSYSRARSPMEAIQILLQDKKHFNEQILKRFIKMLAVKQDK
jgi:HD-GYP domain-containing protein (c-di-GMP phosphodiesterase class II)